MPCRGPDDDSCDSYREQLAKQRRELDKVTRLLCEVMTNGVPHASEELAEWWQNHQELDRKRKAAEEKARREEKKRLLDRADKLKHELSQIMADLEKHK